MKKNIISFALFAIVTTLLSGCFTLVTIMQQGKYYIGSYEMDISKVVHLDPKILDKEIESVADEISIKLNYTKEKLSYPAIWMTPREILTQEDRIIILLEGRGHKNPKYAGFHITIRKGGSDMTPQLARIQQTVESILRKHGFTWTSSLSTTSWN